MARRVLSRHLRAPLPDEATQARYYRVYEGNRLHYHPESFQPLTSAGLFGDRAPLELEVGCGTGEYLCELAHQNPDINYIGLDISPKPLYRAVATAADLDLDNIHFIKANIKLAYPLLGTDSLQRVYLHFPNPHNSKRKFIKHQLFDQYFLDHIHRALVPHGRLSVMTDLLESFVAMLQLVEADPRFVKTHKERYLVGFETAVKSRFQRIWESHGLPTLRFEVGKVRPSSSHVPTTPAETSPHEPDLDAQR